MNNVILLLYIVLSNRPSLVVMHNKKYANHENFGLRLRLNIKPNIYERSVRGKYETVGLFDSYCDALWDNATAVPAMEP